jgi:hypothetical protein
MDGKEEEGVNNAQLQLELKALRSEIRYWIIAAVVASQTLSHIELPPTAGYIGGALVVGFALLKSVLVRS